MQGVRVARSRVKKKAEVVPALAAGMEAEVEEGGALERRNARTPVASIGRESCCCWEASGREGDAPETVWRGENKGKWDGTSAAPPPANPVWLSADKMRSAPVAAAASRLGE